GSHNGIILVGLLMDAVQVILADAHTETNHCHRDAIVGPGYIRRRRLALAVNGCFQQRGRSDGSSSGRGFLDKFAARKTGRIRGFCLFHKSQLITVSLYMTKPNPKEFGVNTAKLMTLHKRNSGRE